MAFKRLAILVLYAAVFSGVHLLAWTSISKAASKIGFKTEIVALNEENPSMREIGGLIYRGGLRIESDHSRFGGLSALTISNDRARFIAISDRGTKIEGALIYDAKGDLKNLSNLTIENLAGAAGRGFKTAYDGDSESMTRLPNGDLLVSFERNHRLLVYSDKPTFKFAQPPELDQAPKNGGIESLTGLLNGDLLALSEDWGTDTQVRGWLWRNNKWNDIFYQRDADFKPSGAATAPNGDVYILSRKFSYIFGSTVRIAKIPHKSIQPKAVLKGQIVAEMKSPLVVDNYEGIDVRAGSDGKNYLYLVSDDNFNPLQNTYLLMFEIKP